MAFGRRRRCVDYAENRLRSLKNPHIHPPDMMGSVRLSSNDPKSNTNTLLARTHAKQNTSMERGGRRNEIKRTQSLRNTGHEPRHDAQNAQPCPSTHLHALPSPAAQYVPDCLVHERSCSGAGGRKTDTVLERP